ncbi:hypothetical protein RE432_18295 [Pusillimonas sp. SM2304]|uniref:hypothetical protein n=1 Tax=Pusillimonas sp. SM2304 TaxID=3073241 RepID=UPI002875E46A|nr:hypothetical protein [Pusillimonas sp. SM2304]MDS1142388.1 hypothetical protein [Pusillimonas sp. SM2304]
MHNLGIPDLPERAFTRHGRNILPQGKGSAPKAPDYGAAAKETAAGNLEAARYATQANRANQYTPWGSIEWNNNRTFDQAGYDAATRAYQQQLASGGAPSKGLTGDKLFDSMVGGIFTGKNNSSGGSGGALSAPNRDDFWSGGDDWTQRITLSPEMQALLDQQNKLQMGLFGAQDAALGRVNQAMGQGFDLSGLPEGGSIYDPNLATNNATELLMQRISPQLDRQNESLRAQLANQGITQGSAAYANAMNQFGQQRNDASTQAALQGIGLGMQQQGMMFGQSEQARQRALAEAAYLRSLPLNELNALRTGNQVSMPQFPGYGQQATTGGADMLGAANAGYNAQLGAYNAQQAGQAGMMGGLFGIGGSILGAAGDAGGFSKLFS